MLINSRNVKGEEIEINTLPLVGSLAPSVSVGVLGTEAKNVLMEIMGHVMGQWFDQYMRHTPTSSYRCHVEFVRQEETMRIVEVAPPANPAPMVPTIATSR
ncbi:hypothetical protein GOBAR_DD21991 [Gossypium barbadense]|nr:hypothetical protein GOBAR_DD21991 [Gossypium barbadense]